MAEEDNPNAITSSFESENDIPGSSVSDFCLLSEDEIAEISQNISEKENKTPSTDRRATSSAFVPSSSVDVQAIKRKAEEIASSLQKFRSNINKNSGTAAAPSHKELPEDIKRHHERSLFVAQKLKEDRILFEESKKRNEAISNKVRTAQRIPKNISDNVRQLKREENDETNALRIKIERLEATVSRLQESLNDKNKIISERNETIRTLNESITKTYDAHMHSLEQSEEEIRRLKNEHSKVIEKITNSQDEFRNQLQIVRKKCLSVENDLKLSDFTRSRLVSKNVELHERINELETENSRLSSIINEKFQETSTEISFQDNLQHSQEDAVISINDLQTKIEFLVFITNEYNSLLTDDPNESEDLNMNDDILKTVDQVGDKLESAFYNIRDKLSSLPKLQNDLKNIDVKLKRLEKLNGEIQQREMLHNEQLSSVEFKLHSEMTTNEELTQQLRSIQEDWNTKYCDLSKLNEQLQYQLGISQDNEINSDDKNYHLEELQNFCAKLKAELETKAKENEDLLRSQDDLNVQLELLQNECIRLKGELEMKTKEYENTLQNMNKRSECSETEEYEKLCSEYNLLRNTYEDLNQKYCRLVNDVNTKSQEYENLNVEYEQIHRVCENPEEAYDKFENDFVLLQKRDCDDEENWKRRCKKLRKENDELLENVRSTNEKVKEYEHERLTLHKYVDECKHLQEVVARLSSELKAANQYVQVAEETKKNSEDTKDEEIEGLQEEMAKLVTQLSQAWDQVHSEKSINHNLEEQLRNSEDVNAKLSNEIHQLQEQNRELGNLKRNNDELVACLAEVRQQVDRVEVEKEQLLLEINKFKEIVTQPNIEAENWKCKYNELLGTISNNEELESWKQHSVGLEKQLYDAQAELQSTKSDLEQGRQQLQEMYAAAEELDSLRRTHFEIISVKTDLERAYHEIQETLVNEVELHKRTQTELQTAKATIKNQKDFIRNLELELDTAKATYTAEQAEILQRTQSELQFTKDELELVHKLLQDSRSSTNTLVTNCTHEVESLKTSIAELKNENVLLREKCESQCAKYNSLHDHVHQIIGRAKSTSDDAARILQNLQTQWNAAKERIDVGVQCNDAMASEYVRNIYENDWRTEVEKYEAMLRDIQQQLDSLQGQYAYAKQQLMQKDEECSVEISRYENLLTQTRNELGVLQERLTHSERQLLQKEEDFHRYKSSMEMLIESDRANYQRYIDELPQQKSAVQTAITTSQVSDFDFLKTEDVSQPAFDVSNEAPSLIKYFDYYKGKVTKELSSILQSEEEERAVDYSSWILPDEEVKKKLLLENQETYERSSQTQINTQNQESQVRIPNADATTQFGPQPIQTLHLESQASAANQEMTAQFSHCRPALITKLPVSGVLDKLKSLILSKYDQSDWDLDDSSDWSGDQLNLDDREFENTAFKFVDLFGTVIQYYTSLPSTDALLIKFKYVVDAVELPEPVTNVDHNHRKTFEQVVTLTTRLECENKYLSDAIMYVEDILANRASVEVIRLQAVIEGWRGTYDVEENDVIDRICEEYDIVPSKFIPGELFVQWKENLVKLLEPTIVGQSTNKDEYCKILEMLKKKVQKLICDLHYVYSAENTFNPRDFFDQIEDINSWIVRSLHIVDMCDDLPGEKLALELEEPGISEKRELHRSDDAHELHKHHHGYHEKHDDLHDHEDDHHDHHNHEHTPADQHDHQNHRDYPHDLHDHDQNNTVAELKALLAESNKKIATLVHELMDVKKSREYNEVRQLHLRLDETLYQLHLKDVHVVELTQELTQLLSERDALQLKLSNILRENEQLRKASVSISSSDSSVQCADLANKLEELNTVNYMKDPRISEASKQYRATEMQLFNEDQSGRSKPEGAGFSVPSLLKWITGETEN